MFKFLERFGRNRRVEELRNEVLERKLRLADNELQEIENEIEWAKDGLHFANRDLAHKEEEIKQLTKTREEFQQKFREAVSHKEKEKYRHLAGETQALIVQKVRVRDEYRKKVEEWKRKLEQAEEKKREKLREIERIQAEAKEKKSEPELQRELSLVKLREVARELEQAVEERNGAIGGKESAKESIKKIKMYEHSAKRRKEEETAQDWKERLEEERELLQDQREDEELWQREVWELERKKQELVEELSEWEMER